jgi:hypothetical protein
LEGLGDKTIPEMEREIFVSAAETGNEVIFEGADGAFCSIASMDSWWD